MKKLRDLIVLLVVFAAFATSLALFERAVGPTSPWLAVMAMFTFLGLAAFARPLFLLKLPGFLRQERTWETQGELYKALHVSGFGALLRRAPLRYLNQLVYLRQSPDPSIVHAQIESAEASHVLAAALLVPYLAYACVRGWWSAVASVMVVQIGFNVYPILHLRWARIRVGRLIGRRNSSRRGA
jgi:Glycosyl-4,4'-diaponeurosporenoate acyltransferase